MTNLPIKLLTNNYDHIQALAHGDVAAEGIELVVDRKTSMKHFMGDPTFQVGEISFSGYIIRLSQGDRSLVGMPVFATRDFRHRCFFVRRDRGLHDLKDLEGKCIGSNSWPDTGNTWSRAALREQGVSIESIRWLMGGIDDPNYDPVGGRPPIDLPPNVHILPKGHTLREMLVAGEADALMCPDPPGGFYRPDSPIVRLIPDYRRAEQEYGRRIGFFPAHHIYAIRREVFEKNPWIAASLFKAMEASKRQSQADRLYLCDSSPWLLADLEEASELFGEDWQPNGVAPNRKMIAALCEEEYAQRLIASPMDPDSVFADFERAVQG